MSRESELIAHRKGRFMLKKVVYLAVLGTVVSVAPAFAQEPRVTVDFTVGYSFADGVSGNAYVIPGVGTFDRIDPKDAFKWGFGIGALLGENAEVGFLYGQAASTLQISGPTQTVDVGDMKINNYHAYFQYNFGDNQTKVRPYIMGGLGATSFGSVDYTNRFGLAATTQSSTKFSSTWGAGVRFMVNPHVGARFGVQWTPTYIKTDEAGWWCDPYWGCYIVGNAQYANQLDLGGGVTFRF